MLLARKQDSLPYIVCQFPGVSCSELLGFVSSVFMVTGVSAEHSTGGAVLLEVTRKRKFQIFFFSHEMLPKNPSPSSVLSSLWVF